MHNDIIASRRQTRLCGLVARRRPIATTLAILLPCMVFAICRESAFPDTIPPNDNAAPTAATLTLDEAVVFALAHNPDLRGSAADVASSTAAKASASAAERVRVSATTYGVSGSMGSIVMSPADTAPQSFINVPSNGFVDQNFTAAIPLSTSGRLKALARSANSDEAAARNTRDAMAHHLAADVATAYVDAVLASNLQSVAQSRVDAETEQVRVIGERVTNGKLAEVDLLREQAELADASQAFTAAQSRALVAVVTLRSAMGADQTTPYALTDTLESLSARWPASAGSLGDAIAIAIAARAETAAATQSIAAAKDRVSAAKDAYAPQVAGFGMIDLNSPVGSGGSGSAGYTVGVSASLPLVDGGQRDADIGDASARLARASADADSLRTHIAGEVANAYLRLAPAASEVLSAQAGVSSAQKAYDLAVMRYDAGKAIAAERLDALSTLTRARGSLLEALAGQIEARLALVRATGTNMGSVAGHS